MIIHIKIYKFLKSDLSCPRNYRAYHVNRVQTLATNSCSILQPAYRPQYNIILRGTDPGGAGSTNALPILRLAGHTIQNAPSIISVKNNYTILYHIYASKLCIKLGNSAFCMKFGHLISEKSLNLFPPDVACGTSAKLGPGGFGVEIRCIGITSIYTRSTPRTILQYAEISTVQLLQYSGLSTDSAVWGHLSSSVAYETLNSGTSFDIRCSEKS